MILASHGIIASQIASFDADALAFFQRVSDATGTLSLTEKQAVNTLVVDMKAAGIWTPMKAIYPMVGASAAACAQNLKSSSFTGTFSSGWTFASTGVTPNGTSAYMDTLLNANTNLQLNSTHLSCYYNSEKITPSSNEQCGVYISTTIEIIPNISGTCYIGVNSTLEPSASVSNALGLYLSNRPSSSLLNGWKNGTKIISDITNVAISKPNGNVYIGAMNEGTPKRFSTQKCAFASIGDGLTDTQASNFYTAVNSFQVSLSRNV
jgi:hypothetical protein